MSRLDEQEMVISIDHERIAHVVATWPRMQRVLRSCDEAVVIESDIGETVFAHMPERRVRVVRHLRGGSLERFTRERKQLPKKPQVIASAASIIPAERETLILLTRESYWIAIETDVPKMQRALEKNPLFVPLEIHTYGDSERRVCGVLPAGTVTIRRRQRVLTDEQRAAMAERLARARTQR